jgi:HAD superfamily hydrolase (TIGR01484 family)
MLFTDIDDTLSTEGRITAEAFQALWEAHDAGLAVTPVTGRPAGWCDHIARMWPVAGIIGENGGLYFTMVPGGLRKVFFHDAETRASFRRRLDAIRDEILRAVPGCAVASDQPCREYDLAIDYCEDVPPLPREAVLEILDIFHAHGAQAKVSSIHVNGWFGGFDKLSMVRRYVAETMGLDLDGRKDEFAFVGDSPNDDPLFAFFPISFGVANVQRFAGMIRHRPAFVTQQAAGKGFAEVVTALLAARKARP